MNYFAHGWRFTDDPYFMAGTALPDWLNVVDRRCRVRSRQALPFVDHADPHLARLAAGVVQHHTDDGWFHESRAFVELSWHLTRVVRDSLPVEDSFRPSFLGHILVELLLDAALIRENPAALEAYYAAIDSLDPEEVERIVNQLAPRPVERLAQMIPLFSRERFLPDYLDDAKLCYRLNQVLKRVKLSPLPAEFVATIAEARQLVEPRAAELLTAPTAANQ